MSKSKHLIISGCEIKTIQRTLETLLLSNFYEMYFQAMDRRLPMPPDFFRYCDALSLCVHPIYASVLQRTVCRWGIAQLKNDSSLQFDNAAHKSHLVADTRMNPLCSKGDQPLISPHNMTV